MLKEKFAFCNGQEFKLSTLLVICYVLHDKASESLHNSYKNYKY